MVREALLGALGAHRPPAAPARRWGPSSAPCEWTEQIDALEVMATDPVHYLVVPRVVGHHPDDAAAGGARQLHRIAGGYMVAVVLMGANPVTYLNRTFQYMDNQRPHLRAGPRPGCFGFLLSSIGCLQGFLHLRRRRGGGGRSTTAAVVVASMAILISDFFLTRLPLLRTRS